MSVFVSFQFTPPEALLIQKALVCLSPRLPAEDQIQIKNMVERMENNRDFKTFR